MIGGEDDFTANNWTWFDKQVRATFLWSWISRVLVDYTNMGSIIGCIMDNIYAPCVSINDSIGTITSYFQTSMVVHPRSNDHLQIHNLIHGKMLSLSSKKQRNGKISLNNNILGADYNMIINVLVKYLYIDVGYLYITNRLISGDISRVIYKLTRIMKRNYFIQAIQEK